ncbi:MAG: hypothetical protein JWM21_1549 [Acidobacteria bacterium]|nr:hypothetical protein [Acidobacteriota bacterium]
MIRRLLLIAVLIALPIVSAYAQQKADFSGTWKLNVAKSDFGALPGPDSRTDVITHKDPSITDDVISEGAQGKQEYTIKYTTDGKEVTNQIGPLAIHSTLKWEGNNLVITSKFAYNDADVNAQSTWALSPDGKTLTISVHFASTLGETDQKIILEKQASAPAAVPAKTP